MSIANDIINGQQPDFDFYISKGESLDDIDDYGFTPLIECAIMRQVKIAEQLIVERGVDINKPDVSGRTALHWAVDNNDLPLIKLLLKHGANANAYTSDGLSVLVFPLLRDQHALKHLLFQHGAKLEFSQDFINAKLIGHRFELTSDVDILNADNQFIELDYEGFIPEFTVAVVKDSLRRFTSSYSTRHLRNTFPALYNLMDAYAIAGEFLKLQIISSLKPDHLKQVEAWLKEPLLIFPVASRGHAIGFVRYHDWWAKVDRGENSQEEGSINIYKITKPERLDVEFWQEFMIQKHPRNYFHKTINNLLGLVHELTIPLSSQISGNCSWANIQGIIPAAIALQNKVETNDFKVDEALALYDAIVEWDQDRALDECIQRFYAANPIRKASLASMLGAVLFQACDYDNAHHVVRAEKILTILTLPAYYYILQSYLEINCVKRLTRRGNNLLKVLDDCGINPHINVTPVATSLKKR